jgi:predicted nucleic acid-binding protein
MEKLATKTEYGAAWRRRINPEIMRGVDDRWIAGQARTHNSTLLTAMCRGIHLDVKSENWICAITREWSRSVY